MIEQRYERFRGLGWLPEDTELVLIGGQGGIGSWLTLFLARAGFKALTYDFDKVEDTNLGGQFFKNSQIGDYKSYAVAENVSEFTGQTPINFTIGIDENTSVESKYTFAAFDSMKARRTLFENWHKTWGDDPNAIFIEGRLEAELFIIYCVTPKTAEYYRENCLPSDESLPDLQCTEKQTSHVAAMIGGMMTSLFTNHYFNVLLNDNIREIPFQTELFTPIMDFNIYNPDIKLVENENE